MQTIEFGAATSLSANLFPAPADGDTGSIAFGTAGILTTPSPTVAIASNNCCNSFPVIGAVAGSSDVTVAVGGVSQTMTITVVPSAHYSLQFSGPVKVDSSVTARLVADAGVAADRTATLSSSNPNVATATASTVVIGPGASFPAAVFGIHGVAAGTTTITATVRGVSYTANVTVQ